MNSQYQAQMRTQGPFTPNYNQPIPQNSLNSFENQGGPGINKGYPPMPYGSAGVQNGQSNSYPGQIQNQSSQVQSLTVPPTNQMMNQMSHDFNTMHLSQNQNHSLLTNNSQQFPQPPNNLGPQFWQQLPSDTTGNPSTVNAPGPQPPVFATCPPNKNMQPPQSKPMPLSQNNTYSNNMPPHQNNAYSNNMPSHLNAFSSNMQPPQSKPLPPTQNNAYMPPQQNNAHSNNMPPQQNNSYTSNMPPQSNAYTSTVVPPPNNAYSSNLPPSHIPGSNPQSNSYPSSMPPPQQNTSMPPPLNSAYPPATMQHGDRNLPPMQALPQDQNRVQPISEVYNPPPGQQLQFNRNSPAFNGSGDSYPPLPPLTTQFGSSSNMQSRYPNASLSPGNSSGGNLTQSQSGSVYGQYSNSYNSQQSRMSSLPQQQAPSRRLDPDHMPSPIQVIEDDRKLRSTSFSTAQRGLVPPLVTTNFTVVDEGMCSPRYIRSTIYSVPTTADILKQTCVPFALAICPFAQVREDEHPPPIVDPGEDGPVRCHRCRAYMSPLMQFIDAGRRFQCLLCKTTSEVPAHYFTHLDHMGERVDKLERAELCLGSYEYIVTKDYCKEGKFPNSPAFIFLIDVSYNSIRSGMVKTLCDNMKSVLACLPREEGVDDSKLRVGFVTYSSVVHFYNIGSNLAQPQMLVVSDVNDMFMPLLDGFLVHPLEAGPVIDSLMEQIPLMFSETRETETILGPAVQAGLEALKAAECAGKLFIFHSTLPIAEAPGKLKNRDDRKLLGTEREKTILTPQSTFYNNLGQECVKAGCSVDLFLFNNAYIDVATLGQVCRLTGGTLYKYTYFQSDLDGERFMEDLRRDVEKPIAFDAVLRVRTSTGIRPIDFTGSFFMSNTTDVELASVNSDLSLTVEIKYDDKLSEEEGVYIQCAVLYTSCSAQRRLRVHNLSLNACSQMADLFRNCELDTMLNVFIKDGIRRVAEETPKQIRELFVSRSAQILACYRKNCAQASSAGQLILPECMKLLPLYINCLVKCEALSGGQEMTTDDRSFIMLAILNMDVDSTAAYLYPRLLPLHDSKPQLEYIELPTAIRCSVERLKESGVYLIENGLSMFLWIGINADPDWIKDVFGVPDVARIDVEKHHLLPLNTVLSQWVRGIVDHIQSERERYMKLYIVRAGDKAELMMQQLLMEDRTTEGSASYVDFLCHLHKEIRTLLS